MKKNFIKVLLLITMLFIGLTNVEAAAYSIGVGSKNLTKGSSTKLTINGGNVIGRFNITSSNSSVISVSEDRAWIENGSYSITLSALNVGTSTITVTPFSVSDNNGSPVSGAQTIQITVSLPREKSKDNTLKSLSVEGYEISPSFDKNIFDYTVNVPEGTKSVNISATPTDGYASVSGAGEVNVVEGINNIAVVVKAENGESKTYNLIVNVVDENPINVQVDGENYTVVKIRDNYLCQEPFTERDVTINDNLIPGCYNPKIDYTLVGLKKEDGTILSFVYSNGKYEKYNELTGASIKLIILDFEEEILGIDKTTLDIDGENYKVGKMGNSSKSYIVYAMNIETGKKDFYLYDTINKTFSLYDSTQLDNLSKLNQTYLYIIIAFSVALLLSVICIIHLSVNKKKLVQVLKNDQDIKKPKKEKKENKEKTNKVEEEKPLEDKKKDNIEEIISSDDDTEMYDLFEDDKKSKKKKKK